MTRTGGAADRRVRHSAIEALEHRVLLSTVVAAFVAQHSFATGADPRSAAVADVNRDGKPDVLVANHGADSVGVLLGNGDGTFAAQRTFTAGSQPYSLSVADVNGDGKPDVLVANYAGASVSVLLGNGDGTFQNQLTFASGSGAYTVVTGDFNGDGKIDAAVSDYTAGAVSILLGNGNGAFSAPSPQAVGATPSGLAVGDVNGDGKADLVATDYTAGTISILLGNGDGTFQPQSDLFGGTSPNSVAVGDLNSDGKADIAVANFAVAGQVSLFVGNGDGSFQPRTTLGTASQPSAIAIADLNRDGAMDLAVSSFKVSDAAVFIGNGNATFQPQKLFPVGTYPGSVAVADVNSDGRPDLVLGDTDAAAVSVLINDPPPRPLSITRASLSSWSSQSSVAYVVTFTKPVTGVDPGDFQVETTGSVTASPTFSVIGSASQYQVTVNGVTGTGTLQLDLLDDGSIKDGNGNSLEQNQPSFSPRLTTDGLGGSAGTALADVNGDGRVDLINAGGSTVGAGLGNGDGTFGTILNNGNVPGARIYFATAADVNGDGRVDVLAASPTTVYCLLGNGDGSFAPATSYASQHPNVQAIRVADLNGDGRPDVVVTTGASHGIGVMLGNGDGTFQPQLTFAGVPNSYQMGLDIADINGDGKPDVVTTDFFSTTVTVWLGDGSGGFSQTRSFYSAAINSETVNAVDLNADGKIDLVVGSRLGKVCVLMGNGDGTFQPVSTIAVNSDSSFKATVADVNGDGKPDIVAVITTGKYAVAVLRGNGDGTFGNETDVQFESLGAPSTSRQNLLTADLNGDGVLDIMVSDIDNYDGAFHLLMGNRHGAATGPAYQIVPLQNTITNPQNVTQLTRDPDGVHIDWRIGTTRAQMFANDPAGLTISAASGNALVQLDNSAGNPLPDILHLNGTFTVAGLQGVRPLGGSTIEMGKSTVYFSYAPGSSPVAAVRQALKSAYNGGAWNGSSPDGVITSAAAANNAGHNTGIGWADSSDGSGVNTAVNTVELKYTLYGDTNLNGTADVFDLNNLLPHYNKPGDWTGGDSTYNGQVDIFDLNGLLGNYNQALPAASPGAAPAAGPTSASGVLTRSTVGAASPPDATALSGGGSATGDDDRARSSTTSRKRHKRLPV